VTMLNFVINIIINVRSNILCKDLLTPQLAGFILAVRFHAWVTSVIEVKPGSGRILENFADVF
jgi:hypothetical protein